MNSRRKKLGMGASASAPFRHWFEQKVNSLSQPVASQRALLIERSVAVVLIVIWLSAMVLLP